MTKLNGIGMATLHLAGCASVPSLSVICRSALLFSLSISLFAQEFDVASIKQSVQSVQGQTSSHIVNADGSMVRYTALNLKWYIGMAYRLKSYQIAAPDWMGSTWWDITAKLPEGSSSQQIPEMMQALLRDRFRMKLHHETRVTPIYGIVIGKGGIQLKDSASEPASKGGEPSAQSVSAATNSAGTTVTYGDGAHFTFGNNRFEGRKLSVAVIAEALSRFADRPVVDRTGLAGKYDFSMEFSPEDFRAMMIRASIASGNTLPPEVLKLVDSSPGDTLFNAVEKLGLKLEPGKAPIEILVIDEARKTPTEN